MNIHDTNAGLQIGSRMRGAWYSNWPPSVSSNRFAWIESVSTSNCSRSLSKNDGQLIMDSLIYVWSFVMTSHNPLATFLVTMDHWIRNLLLSFPVTEVEKLVISRLFYGGAELQILKNKNFWIHFQQYINRALLSAGNFSYFSGQINRRLNSRDLQISHILFLLELCTKAPR